MARVLPLPRIVVGVDGSAASAAAVRWAVREGTDRRGLRLPGARGSVTGGADRVQGRLVQYAGRILRPHPGKKTAEIHDYRDQQAGAQVSSPAKRAPDATMGAGTQARCPGDPRGARWPPKEGTYSPGGGAGSAATVSGEPVEPPHPA